MPCNNIDVKTITDDDARNIKAHQACLLDVRTTGEYEDEKSPYATNIDVHDLAAGKMPDVPKDQPVYVYCRSGNRAELAKHMLEHKGFKHVYNVGGYSGLPKELRS